ncbi:exportin-t [Anaeramoeba flamelloides]|uniref:Exportin-T n=1 Tax=Anaeramoeba flamelloides TaxID=1746091 RepID=A0AAV7Y4T9_9EUKA|nr:exportin-t [Anaeramoeba flamelloides]
MNRDLIKSLERIDQLVKLSSSPKTNCTSNQSEIEELEQIKKDENSWKVAFYGFFEVSVTHTQTRFFCLTILTRFFSRSLNSLEFEEQKNIVEHFLEWISNFPEDEPFCTFPNLCVTLLKIIQKRIENNSLGGVNFLNRLLEAIDYQITSRYEIGNENNSEIKKNIKDEMRNTNITEDIFSILYEIILQYEKNNPKLVNSCLKSFYLHIHWIDINISISENFLKILFNFLSIEEYKKYSINCLIEIVIKGMDTFSKIELLEKLNLIEFLEENLPLDKNEKFNTNNNNNNNNDDDDDNENENDQKIKNQKDLKYFTGLSKLLGSIGIEYILCYTQLKTNRSENNNNNNDEKDMKLKDELINIIQEKVSQFLPLIFQLSILENQEFITKLLPFFNELIQFIKFNNKNQKLNENEVEIINSVFYVIFQKIKYPLDYNFNEKDSYEEEFDNLHIQLITLFRNICKNWKDISQHYIENTLNELIETLTTMENENQIKEKICFNDVEAVLELIYQLMNGLNVKELCDPKGISLKIVQRLINNKQIYQINHYSINKKILWILIRFTNGFKKFKELIPYALQIFLDYRGLKNENLKIRIDCSHLLLRFSQELSLHLIQYIPDILESIKDFLKINNPNNSNNNPYNLPFANKNYLFQCAGVILSARSMVLTGSNKPFKKKLKKDLKKIDLKEIGIENKELAINEQQDFISFILGSIFETINNLLEYQTDGIFIHGSFVSSLANCVDAMISFLKGFFVISEKSKIHDYVIEKTALILQEIIKDVKSIQLIRDRIVSYCHAIAQVIRVDSVPIFLQIFQKLAFTSKESKDFENLLRLLTRYVIYYSKSISKFLNNYLLDIIELVYQIIDQMKDFAQNSSELKRELIDLKKTFCYFLFHLIKQSPDILTNEKNNQYLITILEKIVHEIIENITEYKLLSWCFKIFSQSLNVWYNNLKNFSLFIHQNVFPLMFQIPLNNDFILKSFEGESVISEINQIQYLILKLDKQSFIQYIQQDLLPNLKNIQNININYTQILNQYVDFLTQLKRLNVKELFNNLMKLFIKLRELK